MNPWIVCAALLSCSALFAQEASEKIAFEVASVKPAQPSPMGQLSVRMSADAGMLRYTNVSLRDCIRVAFRVKEFQVEGPDWIETTRFDITAKLPEGSSKEQIPEMLQALLRERFRLSLHRETKDHAVYALVVGKGGANLKPAASPAGGGSPGSSAPIQTQSVQTGPAGVHLQAAGITLAGLAEMIARFAERPVVDMTKIEGQYDFDLVFTPESNRGMMMPPPGGGERAPSDASSEGVSSIIDSVQRYGLKLEPRKAPMEILVVDHIEKTPTEN